MINTQFYVAMSLEDKAVRAVCDDTDIFCSICALLYSIVSHLKLWMAVF